MAAAVAAVAVTSVIYLRPHVQAVAVVARATPTAPTLDPAYQVDYDFVSSTTGWAAVVRSDTNHTAYWVFRTVDGARHWSVQTSGSNDDGTDGIDMRFFDARHGYFVIGRQSAYTTQDGGAHWRPVPLPKRLALELTFADPTHAWFVGTDDVAGTFNGGIALPLFATADGGATWMQLPDPPGGGFSFRTALNGWSANVTDSGGIAYVTYDGGRSWFGRALPLVPSPDGKALGYAAVELIPGRGVLATSGTLAFTSVDDGNTWRQLTLPSGASPSDIAFVDATRWWAMPGGDLFKTADSGQTWQQVSLQFDAWRYHLQVLDARNAWARLDPSFAPGLSRGSGLASTSDGGLRWTYAAVPTPPAA